MEAKNNTANQKFEVRLNAEVAELQYRLSDQTLYLMHTEVPDSMSGKGIASLMAKTALIYAKTSNFQVVAYCPFTVGYVKKHPEYLTLINQDKQSLDRFK